MSDTKTKPVSIRLSIDEANAFDKIEKLTGKSKADLIREKVLSSEDQSEVLDTIVWESEQVQEKIEVFKKAYQADMQSYGAMLSNLQKNIYKTFAELKMDSAMKKNIYMYKQGDLVRTGKNHLLIILSVNEDTHELKATLAPLLSNPEINILNVKESGDSFIAVYRQ